MDTGDKLRGTNREKERATKHIQLSNLEHGRLQPQAGRTRGSSVGSNDVREGAGEHCDCILQPKSFFTKTAIKRYLVSFSNLFEKSEPLDIINNYQYVKTTRRIEICRRTPIIFPS